MTKKTINIMKTKLIALFTLLCMVLGLTACSIFSGSSSDKNFMSLTTFQVLENSRNGSACLAHDRDWNVYYVISLSCQLYKSEMYYDRKDISGRYYILGTYAYRTKGGDNKTVRAIIRRENYNSMDQTEHRWFNSMMKDVLSYYYEYEH